MRNRTPLRPSRTAAVGWLAICAILSALAAPSIAQPPGLSPPRDSLAAGESGSAIPGNLQVSALLQNDLGVGSILVPIGQIADDATVRVITREKNDRIHYPAVEVLSLDPGPPTAVPPRGPNQGPRIGGGALIKRLRGAIDRVREHVDPTEVVRIHFLFRGREPLELQLIGDIERTLQVTPMVLEDRPAAANANDGLALRRASDLRWSRQLDAWWSGYVQQTQRQSGVAGQFA